VKSTFKTINIADIFLKENFRFRGIPKIIVSDRDVKFISKFWKELFTSMGTKLNSNTHIIHKQMDRL